MNAKLGRIFSGIQPSAGVPHLGNYIGAIKPWVHYQDTAPLKPILSVVDLHALTNPKLNPEILRDNIFQMTASLLACGLDPNKCIIFQQSTVPHHTELSWILTCCSTLQRVQAINTWREKVKLLGKEKGAPLGVLVYPLLMAADILLYKTDTIPVGDDQSQNIELTRELATTFNRRFNCNVMKVPEKLVQTESNRIKSLRDPTSKMSKSDDTQGSSVTILDCQDLIRAKIKKAVTDSNPVLSFDPEKRPGVSNLIGIYAAMKNISKSDALTEVESMDTSQLKNAVSDVIIEALGPIRSEHSRLMESKEYLTQVLNNGKNSATEIADETLIEVKKAIGVL